MRRGAALGNRAVGGDHHLHAVAGEDRERTLDRHALGVDIDRFGLQYRARQGLIEKLGLGQSALPDIYADAVRWARTLSQFSTSEKPKT